MRGIRIIMDEGALVVFSDFNGYVWCWDKAARLI